MAEQLDFGNRLRPKPVIPSGFFIYDPISKLFNGGGSSYWSACHAKTPKYYSGKGPLKNHIAQSVRRTYKGEEVFEAPLTYANCEVWENAPAEGGLKFDGMVRDYYIDYCKRQRKKYGYTKYNRLKLIDRKAGVETVEYIDLDSP